MRHAHDLAHATCPLCRSSERHTLLCGECAVDAAELAHAGEHPIACACPACRALTALAERATGLRGASAVGELLSLPEVRREIASRPEVPPPPPPAVDPAAPGENDTADDRALLDTIADAARDAWIEAVEAVEADCTDHIDAHEEIAPLPWELAWCEGDELATAVSASAEVA